MRLPFIAAVTAAALLASPASAQINVSFGQNERDGVCYFSVKGPGPKGGSEQFTLEFSYRVKDGNLGLDLKANSFPKAAKGDSEKNLNVKLETDAGNSKPSRSGGYESGYYQRIWAGWGAGEPSVPVMDLLKKAKIVHVVADGERYGPFDMQIKTLPWNSLNNCAKRVRGEPVN